MERTKNNAYVLTIIITSEIPLFFGGGGIMKPTENRMENTSRPLPAVGRCAPVSLRERGYGREEENNSPA